MILLIHHDELHNYKSRDLLPLTCEHCQALFYKPKNEILKVLAVPDYSSRCRYCSRACLAEVQKRFIAQPCDNCSTLVYKQRKNFRRSKLHFCNTQCLLEYKQIHIKPKTPQQLPKYITLADIPYKANRANQYDIVRSRARHKYKHLYEKGCQHCGFTEHVEVCHRIPITQFLPTAKIDDEVNAPENILILCPNHHWCFDHKKLIL